MRKTLVIILVLVVALFTNCKTDKSSISGGNQKEYELSAGVHAWPGGGTIYLAEEKGYFKKNGVKVKIKKIENFDTKRAALIGGDIDLDIANTMDQLLIYANNGFPIKVIGVTDESIGGDGLISKESINSIADLRGKTIAYAEASPSDFFLRYILKQNGMTTKDVVLKPVADPQIAGNAVISKSVDAAVTYEPFLSQADDTEGLKALVTTKEYPTLIPGLILANGDNISKNPEAYKRFLNAWFEAVEYYYSNRTESEKLIAKGMGVDLAEVKDVLSTIEIQSRVQNISLVNPETKDDLYELVDNISEFWKESGFINKESNGKNLISKELVTGNYVVEAN